MNTKFLVLVVTFSAVAIGGVGLVWGYSLMTNPARNIERGRELEKAGDFDGAFRAYGRAVAKRRSNLEYLDLMRGALLKIVPPTVEEARQLYDMNLRVLQQRARIDPSNPQPWRDLLEELDDRAQFLQNPGAWQMVADTANDMLGAVPKGSDSEQLAKRALAHAIAQRDAQASEAERKQAEEILRALVAADPKDEGAWDALLLIILNDANRLFLGNQRVASDERQKQFDEAVVQAAAALPGSTAVALARSRLIRSQLIRGTITPRDAIVAIEPALDDLERNALLPDATSNTVITAVDQLLATSRKEDAERAIAITENWMQKHPDDMIVLRLQSIALRTVDLDRAIAVSQRVIDSPPSPVSMQTAFRDEIRGDAAERVFDIEIVRAMAATDEAVRASHIKAAEQMRGLLVELSRGHLENPRLLKVEAKLAMLAGDYSTASAKLDRVLGGGDASDAETYLYAAEASMRRNELGAALAYVNRGIERHGATYQLLLSRARLELGLRRGAAAIRTAESMLAIQPNDETAIAIRNAAGNLVEAMSPSGSNDPLVRELQECERLLSLRDFDAARAIADRLLNSNGGDARVLTQAARIDLATGNSARAIERLDAALAVAPNDSYIAQLRAVAGTTDPIERIDKLIELSVSDEKQRPAARYALIMSVIASMRRDIASGGRAPDGQPLKIDDLKASLARLEAEIPVARDAAAAAGASSTALFGARFDEAVLASDFKAAEQVGVDAEKSGDRALGIFLRARALMLQNRASEAVELLEKARQQGINSAEVARELGQGYESLGKVTEALAAYKEAHERRPGDVVTLRSYSDLLQRSGDAPRALQLYRDAAQTATGDRGVLSRWLQLEETVGDKALALCWRRKVYRETPGQRENALALAVMLTDGQADPRLIMDDQCRVRYSEAEWNALPLARRQQEMQAMLKAHQAEGTEIFRSLLGARADDFEVALLQARAMRRNARADLGEELLRIVISKSDAAKVGPMWFGLGQYLEESGRTSDALAAFAEAQKVQDPVQREADLTISNFWFERQQWQRAADSLKPVLAALPKPNAQLLRRASEISSKLRRFDEAESQLKQAQQVEGAAALDSVGEMLLANIHQGRGEDLWAGGNKDAAQLEFAKAEAALGRAAQVSPGNALPWLSLASLQRDVYTRTRDAKVLDKAIANVERGMSMANAFWPGVRLRKEILIEKGDLVGATQVIERFLPIAVNNTEARRTLAELYLQAGNAVRAIAILNEGATLSPSDPGWPTAIGELQMRQGQFPEAVAAFDRALALSPGPAALARAMEARQRSNPADWAGIVALARQYPNDVRSSSTMRVSLGAALVATGERESGLQTLRDAGRFIRDEIAAKRMRVADLDVWYAGTRLVFPPARTAEFDAFVRDTFGGKLTPDDQRWMASVWTEVGPDGLKRAQEYLDLARASMDQQDALFRSRVWLATGNIAYLGNDCAGAIAAFENVVKEDPNNTMAMNNLGFLLAKCQNEHARAIEYARRAVAAAPNVPEYLDTLGFALILNGEFEEARTVLERGLRLAPSAVSYLHLAQALKGVGRIEEARLALDKAQELKPTAETQQEITALRTTLK